MAGIRMFDMPLSDLRNLAVETLDKWDRSDSVDERKQLNATLEQIVEQYAVDAKAACYRAAVNSGDPMRYACDRYFYDAIRVKETKDRETGEVVRSIEDAQKSIDLANLHEKTKGGIGRDHLWVDRIKAFNYYLTLRAADRLGDGTMGELLRKYPDVYKLSEAAKTLLKGELTEESLIASIDEIIKGMIGGEYTADEKDLHELQDNYISNDRKSKTNVNAANHRTLVEIFKKMCYRHINGLPGYGVVTRELKKQQ